jgi:hypothetical protein
MAVGKECFCFRINGNFDGRLRNRIFVKANKKNLDREVLNCVIIKLYLALWQKELAIFSADKTFW